MVKQLRTDFNLLIALHLCQPHYQVLLIIYQKNFIVISVRIANLNLIIRQSKIINVLSVKRIIRKTIKN